MEEGYVSIHQMTIPHPMGKMNSGKYQSLICLFFGIHLKYFFFLPGLMFSKIHGLVFYVCYQKSKIFLQFMRVKKFSQTTLE